MNTSGIDKNLGTEPQAIALFQPMEQPSAVELFSYGLCCAAQGILGILYLALVVFIPLAIRQGLLSSLF